ncbi:MAG: RIFT barrel domain-containing protein [Pseudohaliea sp.]
MAAGEQQLPGPALTVREESGLPLRDRLLRFGLPLPRGFCRDPRRLALFRDGAAASVPATFRPAALWPDHSLKWCQVELCASLGRGETLGLAVGLAEPAPPPVREASPVAADARGLTVTLPTAQLVVDTRRFRGVDIRLPGVGRLAGCFRLRLADGSTPLPVVDDCAHRTHGSGAAEAVTVTVAGHWPVPGRAAPLHFRLRLVAEVTSGHVTFDLRLHNPARAAHPGGRWDLGDPGSVHLAELALGWQGVENRETALRLAPGAPWQATGGRVDLTQWSSGGDHWSSPVHRDHSGAVPLPQRGYTLALGGVPAGTGDRPDPTIRLADERGEPRLAARLEDFWQRFPSALRLADGELLLAPVPLRAGQAEELQGGECLVRRGALLLGSGAGEAVFSAPQVTLDPSHVARCGLAELGNPGLVHPALAALVTGAAEGPESFFAKREIIDEYGWRHFGELYADHENDIHPPGTALVSHYNNQYDPLFGCLRQHLFTAEPAWARLAADLATHIEAIDIYHTSEDRPEYNHGLFWHTDHYLDAGTATHRAYSRLQPANAYEDHAGGGGPGGQHCYTTGLLYRYLLTGDEDARAALYGLRDWITRVYEGGDTVVDLLLGLRNRGRRDLRHPLKDQYPLDRGTGNYLQALLDSYYLDRAPATLAQVARIIRRTLHPAEDLAGRRLDDAETSWYYTVFLQALCRFLAVKVEEGQQDADFLYARDCLLHVADWMLDHEAPYLHRPDSLEFPNQTWTAQDLRKATVLYQAAHFSPRDPAPYREKAGEFVTYVAATLEAEPTRHYTRIQALLLQNLVPTVPLPSPAGQNPPRGEHGAPPRHGALRQAAEALRLALRAVSRLRPAAERAALRSRLPAGSGEERP